MITLLLKNGSTGDNVKKLQKALGITADGVFGTKTEEAVKKFQKENGLYVDGLVGDQTQKALGLNFETNEKPIVGKCMDGCIYNPISTHITKKERTIKYIVIHYTAGVSSDKGSADRTRNVFLKREASADFCVDDFDIVQVNPDLTKYYCWSVGDGKGKYGITNTNSVSIEMCSTLKKGATSSTGNHSGWTVSDKVLDNTVKLTKQLMKKYNIPLDRVIRHYDASRKNCPGLIGWNDGKINDAVTGKSTGKMNNSNEWEKFKERLK